MTALSDIRNALRQSLDEERTEESIRRISQLVELIPEEDRGIFLSIVKDAIDHSSEMALIVANRLIELKKHLRSLGSEFARRCTEVEWKKGIRSRENQILEQVPVFLRSHSAKAGTNLLRNLKTVLNRKPTLPDVTLLTLLSSDVHAETLRFFNEDHPLKPVEYEIGNRMVSLNGPKNQETYLSLLEETQKTLNPEDYLTRMLCNRIPQLLSMYGDEKTISFLKTAIKMKEAAGEWEDFLYQRTEEGKSFFL